MRLAALLGVASAALLGACSGESGDDVRDSRAADEVEGCGLFDVARSRATNPAPLVAGFECFSLAFSEQRDATRDLVFTSVEGARIPTSYTTDGGSIVVVRQRPEGVERQICSALVGDDDGSLLPDDCVATP